MKYLLIGATVGIIALATPGYAQTNEGAIAVCEGETNTVEIYQSEEGLKISALNHSDNITWLNTHAQTETVSDGVNYSNIRGEQTVTLFVPNQQDYCNITMGEQPTESGTLITENMNKTAINGIITYREKIALPPGAMVEVKLLDVSLQDVAAVEIASQTIITQGEQVPIPFELVYDPSQIQEQQTYSVRAIIYIDEKLAFTTTQMYPVLTRDHGTEVELVLQKVSGSQAENELSGTKWLLEDLTGTGVIDNLQTTIEFGESNRIAGSGGCNRYMTSYEYSPEGFKVDLIASTQMMCPEAVMNQERNFFQALEKAYNLRLEGPYLLIDVEGYDAPLKFTRI